MRRPVQKIRRISFEKCQKTINEIHFTINQIHRQRNSTELINILKKAKRDIEEVLNFCIETLEENYKKNKEKYDERKSKCQKKINN